MKTKVNYLNNKDLLEEIHKSKNSYCSYTKDEYSTYDLIVNKIDAINIRTVAQAKRNKAKRLTQQEYERRKAINPKTKLSCLLYTSPSPRDATLSRMPSSA